MPHEIKYIEAHWMQFENPECQKNSWRRKGHSNSSHLHHRANTPILDKLGAHIRQIQLEIKILLDKFLQNDLIKILYSYFSIRISNCKSKFLKTLSLNAMKSNMQKKNKNVRTH